jgi:predicted dehydrogenase
MPTLNLIPEVAGYSKRAGADLRVAVIGFGKMGILHSAILNLLEPQCVRCVVDNSRLATFGASRLFKDIKFYRKIDEMLKKEDPDVIYVTTPVQSHYDIMSNLLGAHARNIFVEKPPTTNSTELASLISKTMTDETIMVGLQKRFALPFRHARMLVTNKVIGEVEGVVAYMRSGDITTPTRRFSSLARGVLLDLGIHLVDLLVWILGADKVEDCRATKMQTDVDDYFEARLRTGDDVKIRMEVTWSSREHRFPETCIEVHGSRGQLTVTEDYLRAKSIDSHEMLLDKGELVMYKPQYYQSFPPVNIADPEYTLEDMHFLSSVNSHTEPLTSLRNVAETMRIIDEMYAKVDMSNGQ